LAAFVDEPAKVTPAQMDRWCRDFDNWAVCDTACFHLFDKTQHAWKKVEDWSKLTGEFQKRASFALLWSLAAHDKATGSEPFLQGLALIEQAADDPRNFVKKAVNMALRAIGKRNAALHVAAVQSAARLATSGDVTARWVGKDALRELNSGGVKRRVAKR
jgi:3-methyladenine DNA glycosylase AlkD